MMKVGWNGHQVFSYGYLDQHTILTKGKTIRDILSDAFLPLFEKRKGA